MGWVLLMTFVNSAQNDLRAFVTQYFRCLLNTTTVSSNHTITLKIHEEKQSLVNLANTISHTNMPCPSNNYIAFTDSSALPLDIYATCATSEERMTQLWKNMVYYARHNMHAMVILHYYCG